MLYEVITRPMLYLRGALPVRQLAGRPRDAAARDRDQARDGVREGRAAAVLARDAEADLDRQPARARHDQPRSFRGLGSYNFV